MAVARSLGRGAGLVSRFTRRGAGTVIGGRVALALAPSILSSLTRGATVIVVSGTNGKTTTTALVHSVWGEGCATNDTGSNMPAGIVGSLLAHRASTVALEVDEAYLASVARSTAPRVIVLLNLSRDQLDRAAEVRLIAERWRAVARDTTATVVANASDPLVVFAAREARWVVWCDVEHHWNVDAVACPVCTNEITFTTDSWSCSCGFTKPAATVRQRGAVVEVGGEQVRLALGLPGAFNDVNAAMALAAVTQAGAELRSAVRAIEGVTDVAGRYSERRLHGQRVRLALAKNPAGFDTLLSMVGAGEQPVWLSLNARVADGLDPSWLYDAPFEKLAGRHVYCFGDRRLDMATRLDLAGVAFTVVDETRPPVSDQSLWAIGNYTAFADWLKESTPW